MKVHRPSDGFPTLNSAVLTMGTFDGIHQGHQDLLRRLVDDAKAIDGESAVVTFHPHPRLVLYPEETDLQLIMTLDEMAVALEKLGIDHFIIVPFDKSFSELSPEEYIKDFLVAKFSPAKIVIGYNHRFGKDRAGDIDLMKKSAANFGFEVDEIPKKEVDSVAVSSTKIRAALSLGAIEQANSLLGHPFSISGEVVKGEQIGQGMGFPTANIKVTDPHKLIPGNGVYAVYITHNTKVHKGMLNIGYRPTFDGQDRTLEVHIFNFTQEIYGELLSVELISRIREEFKFDTTDALTAQLELDMEAALKMLE